MSEEEIIKLRTRLQLAEDSNKILVQKLKNNLYLNEKKKENTIYTALTTRNVDENNYKKAIEWIIKIIEEG